MALAIIGGMPERFRPFVDLFREPQASRPRRGQLPVGLNTHGYVAETSQAAADEFFPSYAAQMTHIGRERGWPPTTRAQFDAGCIFARTSPSAPRAGDRENPLSARGARPQRYLMQMSVGTCRTCKLMRSIELLGTKVAPTVAKGAQSMIPKSGNGFRTRSCSNVKSLTAPVVAATGPRPSRLLDVHSYHLYTLLSFPILIHIPPTLFPFLSHNSTNLSPPNTPSTKTILYHNSNLPHS
jgi:hypothetical protein